MKNNLIGFLLILGAIIFGFSVLLPKIREVRVTTVQEKAMRQVLVNKQQRKTALLQLNGTFASQLDKIKSIMATLPQEPQIPDILVSTEALIKESNVNFTSITPQVNTLQQEVSLVIAGQAALPNIETLMNGFVQNNRPISVSSVNLTKVDNSIGFNIGVTIPYVAEKPKAPTSTGTPDDAAAIQGQ